MPKMPPKTNKGNYSPCKQDNPLKAVRKNKTTTPFANAGFCAARFAGTDANAMQQKHSLARSLVTLLLPPRFPFSHLSRIQSPGSDCTRDWYLLRKDDPPSPPSSPPVCTSVQPSSTGLSLCTVTASATSSASSLRLARGVERRRRF